MKRIFSLCLLTAFLAIAAFADVRMPDPPKPTPAPKQKKTIESNMRIRFDWRADEARLIIPKNQLQQLRAALEEMDGTDDAAGIGKTQTIAGGLFLSLAAVFGGVWFSRSRKTNVRANKLVAAGAVLCLTGCAATVIFANVGPPPRQLSSISSDLFDKQIFRNWKTASGKVRIEVSETGETIDLIVPEKEEKNNEE